MDDETEQIFILNVDESQPSGSVQKPDDVEIEIPGSSQHLENVEDFSHVCRTCATVTEFVIPIFAGEGLQNNLADKIHKHLPIQVCEEDLLPRVVCYQCASTLLAWHELVQCCVQADAALRARLAQQQQELNSTNSKSDANLREADQSKFSDMPEYMVQGLEPPQYRSPRRACSYCSSELQHAAYKEHLVTAHADLLFYCEECDKYIDRKDFILHMSLHAVHYTNGFDKKDKRKKVRKKHEETDVNQNTSEVCEDTNAEAPMQDLNISDIENQQNEFSDHSDEESGFGPLPESVFEAIEDTQDSQSFEEEEMSEMPQNEQLSDESNGSDQPALDDGNISNSFPITDSNDVSSPAQTPIETNDINNELPPVENSTINNLALTGETCETSTPAQENNDMNETDPPDKGQNPKKKTRTCPICSKVYTASSSYFYHMKYFHKGIREHECDMCGKKFGTRASLTQHKAVHSNQYELECKQCKKQFKSKASLYIHEQTHNGKKSWSCTQCHISFRWKTHLLRHMKRHLAEKCHVCTTCGRGFTVRCDLLRHARTHTAGSFTCDKCGVQFAQLRYLKVHIVKQHSTNIAQESE